MVRFSPWWFRLELEYLVAFQALPFPGFPIVPSLVEKPLGCTNKPIATHAGNSSWNCVPSQYFNATWSQENIEA